MENKVQYAPTPQELASWQNLQKIAFIDGGHDLLPAVDNDTQKSAPFAFDLRRELQLTQEFGNDYLPHFLDNAHYYAKESYGRVPVSEYEHTISIGIGGKPQLTLGPDNISARECYMEPVLDLSKPDWYRKRSWADVRWAEQMERALAESQDGDTFLDISPTEYGVSVDERKKWGYGYHSFVRLHKVVNENGEPKLVSRAIRNYLDAPEQEALFEQLTGRKVDVSDMLGMVTKVHAGVSQAMIRVSSDILYENTPDDRKIVLPDDQMVRAKTESDMEEELKNLDGWLMVVFEMMQQDLMPREILKQFRGWENVVRDFVEGENSYGNFRGITVDEMRELIYRNDALVTNYTDRVYEAGASGCGLGSGFGEPERTAEGMTYESMTKTTGSECPEIKCKKCPWKADEHEVEQITKGKLSKCPKCGWKP